MANVIEINDHVNQAIARLLEQYKGKENLEGTIRALVEGFQSLEGMFFDLRDNRSLDNATGETLNFIGSILGVPRVFLEPDETYRARIRIGVFTNRAQGTPSILIAVAQNFTAAGTNIVFYEGAIASFAFNIDDQTLTQVEINGLLGALKAAKAAGVTIEHVTAYNSSNAFSFAGLLSGGGFGDIINLSIGGEFASILVET